MYRSKQGAQCWLIYTTNVSIDQSRCFDLSQDVIVSRAQPTHSQLLRCADKLVLKIVNIHSVAAFPKWSVMSTAQNLRHTLYSSFCTPGVVFME